MGLVNRFERRLESTVGDAFARVFGGSIVPQEVEAMLQREAEAGAREVGAGRVLASNDYVITLSGTDYQKVSADPALTSTTFARHLEGYIRDQGWQTYGEVVVRFEAASNLHTGQFRTRGAVNPDSTASEPAPAHRDRTDTAEPGVPPMTDSPNYRGGQGQGQPGDDYYDDDRQAEERSGQHPPEQGGYPPQGAPAPGYPRRPPATYDQGGYQEQGGYPPQGAPAPGYPPRQPGYPEQGGYPDQGYRQPPAGYPAAPPAPPAAPAGGYGAPGADYDYGRQPAAPQRHDDYGRPESRPAYPEQGRYPEQGGYPAPGRGYPWSWSVCPWLPGDVHAFGLGGVTGGRRPALAVVGGDPHAHPGGAPGGGVGRGGGEGGEEGEGGEQGSHRECPQAAGRSGSVHGHVRASEGRGSSGGSGEPGGARWGESAGTRADRGSGPFSARSGVRMPADKCPIKKLRT